MSNYSNYIKFRASHGWWQCVWATALLGVPNWGSCSFSVTLSLTPHRPKPNQTRPTKQASKKTIKKNLWKIDEAQADQTNRFISQSGRLSNYFHKFRLANLSTRIHFHYNSLIFSGLVFCSLHFYYFIFCLLIIAIIAMIRLVLMIARRGSICARRAKWTVEILIPTIYYHHFD